MFGLCLVIKVYMTLLEANIVVVVGVDVVIVVVVVVVTLRIVADPIKYSCCLNWGFWNLSILSYG